MSLVAAMLCGASAFAIENVKVDGDARLYYYTVDEETTALGRTGDSLFDEATSTGEAALRLGATADLTDGVSGGATLYAVSTLGLYNNLVSSTWTGGVNDNWWFGEAWVSTTKGNTTAKIGRVELDTPLVFTESWSIVPNTFEAAVLVNTDIPDTTLVAAYVGQSNGGVIGGGVTDIGTLGGADFDARSNLYSSFYEGAYTVGIVNNSLKPLTAQAWYYDAQSTLKAYWVQADLACEKIPGLIAGVQYAGQNADGANATFEVQSAYAAKLGYEIKVVATISAAYSSVSDDAGLNIANYDGSESKLYTEMYWYFGEISAPDTDSFKVAAEGSVADIDWMAQYVSADHKTADTQPAEITVAVSKSYGALDTSIALSNFDADVAGTDAVNVLQVYLQYNF